MYFHIPVMPEEVIKYLNCQKKGIYFDATIGDGGHAEKILEKIGSKGTLIGIDRDKEAIKRAKKRLEKFKSQTIFIHENFRNLKNILFSLKPPNIPKPPKFPNFSLPLKIDGVLLDLGVSTYQLMEPKRGFSFSETEENLDVPLDMRMDQTQPFSALDVINNYPEKKLREVLFKLGEEPYARSIARKIIQKREIRPITTTNDLLEIIKFAIPRKYKLSRKHGHFASKVFRGIRMEVNQELPALKEAIEQAIDCLKPKGRLVIISFHSLEDRVVKHKFKQLEKGCVCPPKQIKCSCGKGPKIKILTKKPVLPTKKELEKNPKADSAKLRAAERI